MSKRNVFGKMVVIGMISIGVLRGAFPEEAAPEIVWASLTDGGLLVEGLDRAPDYYILPNSSKEEVSKEDVGALDDYEKQMAINEIYARHGRRFVIAEVQDYFNEKVWYYGTVAAKDFDEAVFNEYESKNVERLAKSLHYLFPGSNVRYLTKEELTGYTKEELQLGINEIYARRGRKFSMKEYREYFEDKPWYNGTIEPEDFDETVFNDYENVNIQRMLEAMETSMAEGELPLAIL